jgi:hypothetical protein
LRKREEGKEQAMEGGKKVRRKVIFGICYVLGDMSNNFTSTISYNSSTL